MTTQLGASRTGPDRTQKYQSVLLVLGLFICFAAYFATVPRFQRPFATPIHHVLYTVQGLLWWEYYALGLFIVSALLAARDQTLRRAWLVTFAWGAGVGVNFGGIGIGGDMPGVVFCLFWALVIGSATAGLIGTPGGLLGRVLSRLLHN